MTQSVSMPTPPVANVPWEDWHALWPKVNQAWDPENTPHHSIIGLTGSGKSYLGINGILKPMCPMDRVVILDVKRDDKLVSTTGRAVRELPRNTWYTKMGRRGDEPFDNWWRIVVHEDTAKAKEQVYNVLRRVFQEGNYVLFVDELHYVTSREQGFLGLGAPMEKIYRYGRNKHVSVVAATQSPRWITGSFYDQASFAWIGHIRDELRQKRLLEIGGMSKKELPYISTLQRREWLLSADGGQFFARTTVKI